jgi:type IV secretory pathway VirB10-like protein
MNAKDPMSPDASPQRVPPGPGVRRVNDLPAYIVVTLMGLFLVVMGLVAMDRSAKQNPGTTVKDEKADNASRYAAAIVGDQKDGIIHPDKPAPPPVPVTPPVQSEPILVARPDNLDLPPAPPRGPQTQAATREEEERNRIRMAKLQMLEEGVKAKTGVAIVAPRSAASSSPPAGAPATRQEALAQLAAVRQQIEAQGRDNSTAAYQARLQQLQVPGAGTGAADVSRVAPTLVQRGGSSAGGGKELGQFAGMGQEDRWKLDAQPEAPRSPYELRAGFVVPATLISGINSDLPGQIMAQVSQDVFDTPTGRHRLIPQGARLIGRYSSEVAYGQARVLVAWQRIVFPDGKAMDIGAMPGADSAGFAGFNDEVNNHYIRLFAGAFLMSGVTAGIALSQDGDRSAGVFGGRPTASSALSEALGQQLGQTTAQLISRNLSIAPTLAIRPGYRFNVVVTKDMTFSKPYKAFDY